ncbi:twin-arginine translocase TatA/TatE family subunit [Leucobacter sp. USHLN153]|uniref:twin-arginine translocase TatA/TatE family subunit n=1 Tax=Leucobacter sp. USHLN153 TaxID=3081268 RepID=UPI003018A809
MGLTIEKFMVILVIAMFVLGPDRLPMYARKLGELVRNVKHMADGAKDRLKDEMGPDFDDVDWRQLDPRQYDPRRIIRDALLEDEREARNAARRARMSEAEERRGIRAETSTREAGAKLLFDEEAT